MLLVGLTGGIGAGKSTVAHKFEQLGAHIIDADQLAREAVAPHSPGLQAIVDAFGSDVLLDDGGLNRAALGRIVFGDQNARARLESIVHPEVARLSSAAIAHWRDHDPTGVVIYDIPLLVESKNSYDFDAVVVVSANPELRIRRLVELRGMTTEDARARVNSQASEDQRLAIADYVIESGGTLDQTLEQVESVWSELRSHSS